MSVDARGAATGHHPCRTTGGRRTAGPIAGPGTGAARPRTSAGDRPSRARHEHGHGHGDNPSHPGERGGRATRARLAARVVLAGVGDTTQLRPQLRGWSWLAGLLILGEVLRNPAGRLEIVCRVTILFSAPTAASPGPVAHSAVSISVSNLVALASKFRKSCLLSVLLRCARRDSNP